MASNPKTPKRSWLGLPSQRFHHERPHVMETICVPVRSGLGKLWLCLVCLCALWRCGVGRFFHAQRIGEASVPGPACASRKESEGWTMTTQACLLVTSSVTALKPLLPALLERVVVRDAQPTAVAIQEHSASPFLADVTAKQAKAHGTRLALTPTIKTCNRHVVGTGVIVGL
eukprot:793525-Alexandrium_andersonii.AAC.1